MAGSSRSNLSAEQHIKKIRKNRNRLPTKGSVAQDDVNEGKTKSLAARALEAVKTIATGGGQRSGSKTSTDIAKKIKNRKKK